MRQNPRAPYPLARLAAVAALAEPIAPGARVEPLAAGPTARKTKRLLDSLMLVHASIPRTRDAHGLTRRLLSGTVRGVQSRVRVWAEGSGLPPWAFTLLCVHFVAPSTPARAPTRAGTLPAGSHARGWPLRPVLNECSGVLRPDASRIRRFFASLYKGNLQRLGNLADRHTVDVVQDEHGPTLQIDRIERGTHELAALGFDHPLIDGLGRV